MHMITYVIILKKKNDFSKVNKKWKSHVGGAMSLEPRVSILISKDKTRLQRACSWTRSI